MKPNPELWVYIRPSINGNPIDTDEFDLEFYTVKIKSHGIHHQSKIALNLLKQQQKLSESVDGYVCYIPNGADLSIIGKGTLDELVNIPQKLEIPFKTKTTK